MPATASRCLGLLHTRRLRTRRPQLRKSEQDSCLCLLSPDAFEGWLKGDAVMRYNVGVVSIDDGKVRHDWTEIAADHVIHRGNDGKMS